MDEILGLHTNLKLKNIPKNESNTYLECYTDGYYGNVYVNIDEVKSWYIILTKGETYSHGGNNVIPVHAVIQGCDFIESITDSTEDVIVMTESEFINAWIASKRKDCDCNNLTFKF